MNLHNCKQLIFNLLSQHNGPRLVTVEEIKYNCKRCININCEHSIEANKVNGPSLKQTTIVDTRLELQLQDLRLLWAAEQDPVTLHMDFKIAARSTPVMSSGKVYCPCYV